MANMGQNHISDVVRHYSLLFTFPSYSVLLAFIIVSATVMTTVSSLLVSQSLQALLTGIVTGVVVFVIPTILADLITSVLFRDALLNLRRLTALSSVVTILWVTILVAGTLLGIASGLFVTIVSVSLGGSFAIGLRFLVVRSLSAFNSLRVILPIFLQPLLCLCSANLVWYPISDSLLLVTVLSVLLTILSAEILLRALDSHGERSQGLKTMKMFRGFIADWLEGISEPLEDILESMSKTTDVSARLLSFGKKDRTQGLVVVVDAHPGPFKNVGSSNLPFEIQDALGKETGSTVIVPHGSSGHERDLASRKYCQKLIDVVILSMDSSCSFDSASQMTRCYSGIAQASCQMFGEVALLTLTLAPDSMEDIPFEIGIEIIDRAKAIGAKDAVIIDAHNSIRDASGFSVLEPSQLENLKMAAESAVRTAFKNKREGFEFGISRIIPEEFGPKEGFGPGGIAVAVVQTQGQRAAYVVFDGNNVITGFREEVRKTLSSLVDDCEVLTTDTHVVNGVSTTQRGYHPVGEVGNQGLLLAHVKACTSQAISQLERCSGVYNKVSVSEMLVVGEEKLRNVTALVDSSVRWFRNLAILIYIPTIALVLSMFMFLP